LAAVSNAARGGAKAAQETADAALVGVNSANERISSLDDYEPQGGATVLFRRRSAVLSADAKSQLDQLAQKALQSKGYVLEVSGFASQEGGKEMNRRLSQQRADNVIRYLVENHNIPLRRIITPYGYGELNPVADNTTRAGRSENRRVEIKILVSRGLTQGPTQTSSSIAPE
jgi:outer membrane protein OmpA-like peptidoglycan-associated protein